MRNPLNDNMMKVLRGAGIAFVGAGLTALIAYLGGLDYVFTVQGQDLDLTLAVGALLSVVVNALRKFYPGLIGIIKR